MWQDQPHKDAAASDASADEKPALTVLILEVQIGLLEVCDLTREISDTAA
jgi:hypothetical protein